METTDAPPPVAPAAEPDYFAGIVGEVMHTLDPESHPAPKAGEPPVVDPPAEKVEDTPVVETKEEAPKAEDTSKPEESDKDEEIDSIEQPGSKTTPATENWNKLKETAKNYKAKATAAEGVILEKDQTIVAKEAEILRLNTELSELSELRASKEKFEEQERELAITRVEGTQEYKTSIVKPLAAIEERAEKIAKFNEISVDEVLDALGERDPDKQRDLLDALVVNLKPVDQLTLVRMAEDTRVLLDKRDSIKENYSQAAKELTEKQEKEQIAAKEKATKEYASSVDTSVAELRKRLPFTPLTEGETADAVFAGFLNKAKETDFDAATPMTKATAAVALLALDRSIRQNQADMEKIKTLEARIAESNKVVPSITKTDAPAPKVETDSDVVGDVYDFLKVSRPAGLVEAFHGR